MIKRLNNVYNMFRLTSGPFFKTIFSLSLDAIFCSKNPIFIWRFRRRTSSASQSHGPLAPLPLT